MSRRRVLTRKVFSYINVEFFSFRKCDLECFDFERYEGDLESCILKFFDLYCDCGSFEISRIIL